MLAIPCDEVRTAPGLWLPYVVIAGICPDTGLSAIALSLLRARDRLLFCVGVFSTQYALHLFRENDLVRNAFFGILL